MESYLTSDLFDLVSPDGKITSIENGIATVFIENISPEFMGFRIDPKLVSFNLKSTLAQLGINGAGKEYSLDPLHLTAEVKVQLVAYGKLAETMLPLLEPGAYIGKLFAADERRRVRDPDYLLRMLGRADRNGKPLLSFGSSELILEKKEGRTVALLPVKKGYLSYDPVIFGFLPVLAKALLDPNIPTRHLLGLCQKWETTPPKKEGILLLTTDPLHIRTAFGRVVDELLPKGYQHTTASVLDPDTQGSGDVYELFGRSEEKVKHIPLEFYTLEPHREYVFFTDRDQLKACLENPDTLFKVFETAPGPIHRSCAVFVVKGEQLLHLTEKDWISRDPHFYDFPGLTNPETQGLLAERYMQQQPSYPFLKAIEDGLITSQGVLFSRYLTSPLMKKMIFSKYVQHNLKGIYFQHPSLSYGNFFSHEDRSFLFDLAKFGIPVFWVDSISKKILQYIPKPGKDSGMFVPLDQIDTFIRATTVGIYGSNLVSGDFEAELKNLLRGLLQMRLEVNHLLLSKDTPLALVTGGGPGVMEVGNRAAREVGILSCANIADFKGGHEQLANPYIDAKMTYRLDRLIERQDEFNLDLPIFLIGGIGTDFEYALEEVRRKTGSTSATPVLLFGDPEYWKRKITSRFQCNLENGTISGSEWISNCFYCIQTAAQGLNIYRQFFSGTLPIGKNAPVNKDGFSF